LGSCITGSDMHVDVPRFFPEGSQYKRASFEISRILITDENILHPNSLNPLTWGSFEILY